VRAANAYIFRYWLGGRFYFVSTNYVLDPVCILHLPGAAKERQLKLLYRSYSRKGVFPPPARVHRLCCLPAARPPLLATLRVRLLARLPDETTGGDHGETQCQRPDPEAGDGHQEPDPPTRAERRRTGADDARHQGGPQRHRQYLH